MLYTFPHFTFFCYVKQRSVLIKNYFGIIHLVRTQIFWKTNISYLLIRTRMRAYQGARNFSFSENFAYALNEWPTPVWFYIILRDVIMVTMNLTVKICENVWCKYQIRLIFPSDFSDLRFTKRLKSDLNLELKRLKIIPHKDFYHMTLFNKNLQWI